MRIQTTASTDVLPYVQDMRARQAAKLVADQRKAEIDKGATAALSSPRINGAESAKQQAKAKLQQIGERLKILRKLFAGNPKEMAKALAQVFKELKAAVKAYKDAGGREMGLSNDLAASAMQTKDPEEPAGQDAEASASGDADAVQSEDKTADEAPEGATVTPQQGSALYAAVATEVRERVGEDGLDFAKMVRGMANKISELLETARTQARARKPDKDTDKAFEDADKELKSLRDDLADMERDIHMAAPTAGMKLEAAA